MTMDRRTLLRTGFAAAAATAIPSLAACSGGGETSGDAQGRLSASQMAAELDKPTTLTFWTWVADIKDEVALFTKKYPKIKVDIVNAGQGSAQYTKLRTALTAKTGAPDVAQIEFQYLPTFTITGDLVDLTPYGAGDLKDKFVDWAWSQCTADGKIYAIPQDTGPMGMLYRKDIFDRHGIAVPKTWDEFAQAARKLHTADPKMYLTNLPPNEAGAWTGLVWQAGSQPFVTKGASAITIALNDAPARKVAEYWTPLVRDGVVSIDPDFTDQWYQGLANDKYAAWLTAAWGPLFLQGTAKNTSGKWRAAPLPQWGSSPASGNWGGSTSAVIKGTKSPVAAAALAQFLNSDPESTRMLATSQFLYPATKALLTDDSFVGQKLDFYGGQDVNKVFAEISTTVPEDFTWSPFQDQVYSSSNDTLGKAITDRQDLVAGLDKWQDAVVEYAKKQGFTVTTG